MGFILYFLSCVCFSYAVKIKNTALVSVNSLDTHGKCRNSMLTRLKVKGGK